MDNINKDRILLEQLDNLLANRSDANLTHLDDDTSTTLEVARKIVALGKKPTKEFSADLKAQLIHRLAEQEKANSRSQSFFFWELSRRKKWQGTIAALIFLAIAAIILLITFLNRP